MMGEFADDLYDRAMQQAEDYRAFLEFFKNCDISRVVQDDEGSWVCLDCGKSCDL